ncbi:unnamed protein product [Ectocarpus sp. 6 AP-2014]
MIRDICNEAPTIDNGGNPSGDGTSSTSARSSNSNPTKRKGHTVPYSAGEGSSAAPRHDAEKGASKRMRDVPLTGVARGGIVPKIEVEIKPEIAMEIKPTELSLTGGAASNGSADDASSTEVEDNGADGDADSAADEGSIADTRDEADSDWLPDVEDSDSDEASIADTRDEDAEVHSDSDEDSIADTADEDAEEPDINMPAVVAASGAVVPQMARYIIFCPSCYYWSATSNSPTLCTRTRSTHVA